MDTVIWDFDGTLGYRSGGRWTASVLEVARREVSGPLVTEERIRPFLRTCFPWNRHDRPHPELGEADAWWEALEPAFSAALRHAGLSADRAQIRAKEVRPVYLAPDRWRLYEDTIPALTALSEAGWRHVLLSNHVPELRGIIGRLGLESLLERIFNSAETGYEKPHPTAFRQVLATLRDNGRVWMVGDSRTADAAGAESVGIPALLVRKEEETTDGCCTDLWAVVSRLSGKDFDA